MFANGLGWPHLLILAVVFLVFFGSKRLPDAARSVGRSLKVFKAETADLRGEAPAGLPQQNSQASPAAQPATNLQPPAANTP